VGDKFYITYQKMKEIGPIPRRLRFFRPGHPKCDRADFPKKLKCLITFCQRIILIRHPKFCKDFAERDGRDRDSKNIFLRDGNGIYGTAAHLSSSTAFSKSKNVPGIPQNVSNLSARCIEVIP